MKHYQDPKNGSGGRWVYGPHSLLGSAELPAASPRAPGAAIGRRLVGLCRLAAIAMLVLGCAVAGASAEVEPALAEPTKLEIDLTLELRRLMGVQGLNVDCPDTIPMTQGATFVCTATAVALPEPVVVTGVYVDDRGRWDASIDDPRAKVLLPALDETMALWNDGNLDALVAAAVPYDAGGNADGLLEYFECRRRTLGRYQGRGEVTGFLRLAEAGLRGVLRASLRFAAGAVDTNIFFMPDDQGRWHAGGWDMPSAPPDSPLPSTATLQPVVESAIDALYTGRIDELPPRVVGQHSEERLTRLRTVLQEQMGALLNVREGAVRSADTDGWVLFETMIEFELKRVIGVFELQPCGDVWLLADFELTTAEPAIAENVPEDARTFSVAWLESVMLENLRRDVYGPSLTTVRCPGLSGELRQGVRHRCIAEIPTGGENDFYVVVTDDLEDFAISDP